MDPKQRYRQELAAAEPRLERLRLDSLVELLISNGEERLEAEACEVMGEVRMLEHALTQLIVNARMHGKGIRLVRVLEGRVEIHDRGAGIVEPARWLHAGEGGRLGGLALAQLLITKHGGTLSLAPLVCVQLPTIA